MRTNGSPSHTNEDSGAGKQAELEKALAAAKEENKELRKHYIRRQTAFVLRHAKHINALEAKLAEASLAYDSLCALFQRRVYSLGDLDESASRRLSCARAPHSSPPASSRSLRRRCGGSLPRPTS